MKDSNLKSETPVFSYTERRRSVSTSFSDWKFAAEAQGLVVLEVPGTKSWVALDNQLERQAAFWNSTSAGVPYGYVDALVSRQLTPEDALDVLYGFDYHTEGVKDTVIKSFPSQEAYIAALNTLRVYLNK